MYKEDKRLIIEYLIAHKNNLWTGFIILLGGLVGLLLNTPLSLNVHSTDKTIKFCLLCIGFLLIILMSIGLTNINNEIKDRLNK